MHYMVIHPHSQSNPTDTYRVVRYLDWLNWEPHETEPIPSDWVYEEFSQADDKRNELNEGWKEGR